MMVRTVVVLAMMFGLLAPSASSVAAAGISVSPGAGAIGTNATVSGNGFAATKTVSIFFNGSGGTLVGAESSDGAGNLAALNVVIPSVTGATYQIFATDGTNTATANFNVPFSLTLNPTSGGQGTGVSVSGTGFLSGEGIVVGWDQAGTRWPRPQPTAMAVSRRVFPCRAVVARIRSSLQGKQASSWSPPRSTQAATWVVPT
jgi:hypothetical protein